MGAERIEVSFGKTINKGNFSSVRVDIGYARDLRHGESIGDAISEETKMVEGELNAWAETT